MAGPSMCSTAGSDYVRERCHGHRLLRVMADAVLGSGHHEVAFRA